MSAADPQRMLKDLARAHMPEVEPEPKPSVEAFKEAPWGAAPLDIGQHNFLSGAVLPGSQRADIGRPGPAHLQALVQNQVVLQTTEVAQQHMFQAYGKDGTAPNAAGPGPRCLNPGVDAGPVGPAPTVRDELVMRYMKGDVTAGDVLKNANVQASGTIVSGEGGQPPVPPPANFGPAPVCSQIPDISGSSGAAPNTGRSFMPLHTLGKASGNVDCSASAGGLPAGPYPSLAQHLRQRCGTREYYGLRATMLKQQEVFTKQLWDLHKLQAIQKLLWSESFAPEHRNMILSTRSAVKSRRNGSESAPVLKKVQQDVGLLLNIPKAIRGCVPGSNSEVVQTQLRVGKGTPGVIYPTPQKLESPDSHFNRDDKSLMAQPTVQQAASRPLGTVGEKKPKDEKLSIQQPGPPSSRPSVQEDKKDMSPQLYRPTAQVPHGVVKRMPAAQINTYFDPHAHWFAKHFDKGAEAHGASGSGAQGGATMATIPETSAATKPSGSAPSNDGVCAPKVLRWWQDCGQTFGELGERGVSDVMSKPPAKIAGRHRVDSHNVEVTSAHTGSSNGKRPLDLEFSAPLKKRAKYSESASMSQSVDFTKQCSAPASVRKLSRAAAGKDNREKARVVVGGSAFQRVIPTKARSKRGSNRVTRTESIGSDNSSAGVGQDICRNKATTVVTGTTMGQSTAKSAAGILLSLSSSYHMS